MNIFTRKKALLEEIDDLNIQIHLKSKQILDYKLYEERNLKVINDKTKECDKLSKEIDLLKESLKKHAIEYDKLLKSTDIKMLELFNTINQQKKEIADLKDTNNGLASSVNELKGKLKAKEKRISELKARLESLKSKALKP